MVLTNNFRSGPHSNVRIHGPNPSRIHSVCHGVCQWLPGPAEHICIMLSMPTTDTFFTRCEVLYFLVAWTNMSSPSKHSWVHQRPTVVHSPLGQEKLTVSWHHKSLSVPVSPRDAISTDSSGYEIACIDNRWILRRCIVQKHLRHVCCQRCRWDWILILSIFFENVRMFWSMCTHQSTDAGNYIDNYQ